MGKHITDEELYATLSGDPFHVGLAQWEKAAIEQDARAELDRALEMAILGGVDECFSEAPPPAYHVFFDDDWNEDTLETPTRVFPRPPRRPLVPAEVPKLEEPERVELGEHEAAWFAGLSPVEAAWFMATIITAAPTYELVRDMVPYAKIW